MFNNRYRTTPQVSTKGGMAKGLPLALLGIAGLALWQNRDKLGGVLQDLKTRFGANGGSKVLPEVIPADYDYKRHSVFNSTAMAGPDDGAGGLYGSDGGTMATDLGSYGEGTR